MLYIMPYIIYMIHLFNIFHRIFCSYFTLFPTNIVILCTFFHRIYVVFAHFSRRFYAEWCTRTQYTFRYSIHQTTSCSTNILHLIIFCCIYILYIFNIILYPLSNIIEIKISNLNHIYSLIKQNKNTLSVFN